MIFDHFSNLKRYAIPQLDKIQRFISENNCLVLPSEQIDIQGSELFVKVMQYTPRPVQENNFETHQVYADLQYVISGVELMQVTPVSSLTAIGDYDAKGDYQFFKAEEAISDLVVHANEFTVFYPGEPHRPACQYKDYRGAVKKLVFKIRI